MKRFYHPLTLYDLERLAEERLATDYWHIVAGGVGDEITLRRNREAFDAIAIRPRLLTDVTTRDLSTTVLGRRISIPVMVPPAGTQVWAHPDGDVATARAACAYGTVMSLRAGAGKTVAEVRRATTGPLWYGVKHYPDEVTEYLIGRAMEAGVQAICITIAGPGMGATRQPDVRGFSPSHDAPIQSYVGKWADLADRPDLAEMMENLDGVSYPPLDGKRLEWLKGLTGLPLIVKEVMTGEDALRAVDHGADAVVVSNHGGRTFDGMQASIEVLPEIAAAVGDRAEVYLDSGVRRGTDVLKALALGARAVMVGRPVFWGLAIDGEAGVRTMFQILLSEFDTAMAMCGCTSVADIDERLVVLPGR